MPAREITPVYVVVAHSGYVAACLTVYLTRPTVNYTVALEPADTIGGIVRDEQGQPIAGAKVLCTESGVDLDPLWTEIVASLNSSLVVATTDREGRWRASAPRAVGARDRTLIVLASHPDHVTTTLRTTATKARAFPIEQIMKTGFGVSGTVFSPFGRPLRGASVVVSVPPSERMFLRFTTDENGQFHSGQCFDPVRTKPIMTVLAPGLAMAVREIVLTPTRRRGRSPDRPPADRGPSD